jgi:predicted ATPase/DNA-binding winged helix-turn-helix (wHTH) protein
MPAIVHHFGRVEVRPLERQVLIDGRRAALGARAFEVLNVLIERRDRAVTKDELLDLVWTGVVVQENNLQVQVSALRKLLGANAIATIPGRGYRFTLNENQGAETPVTHFAEPPLTHSEALIGREEERAHLVDLLRRHRLVVVIGAGGVGKSALAHAIAHAADPKSIVGWVDLAPIADFASVPGAIARALQLQAEGALPVESLVSAARPSAGLLVLDNADHLVDPLGQLVLQLLEAAPGLRVLVTSQAPLKVDGEWLFRLGPLSCPQAGARLHDALEHGAIAMFVAQASAAGCDFSLDERNVDLVIEICRQVDGIPLAVKLAAGRLPLLGLSGLHEGLAQRLRILRGGAPSVRRQATLQAAFDWSHGLLSEREQLVFRRLAVFVGGFTLSAASALCGDERISDADVVDALGALVDHSLVVVEADAQPRYRLLWSAREYALAQLERCGERAACERRHANAKLALPERSDGKLRVALHPDGPLRAADEGIVLTETAVCGIGRAMRARIGQDT